VHHNHGGQYDVERTFSEEDLNKYDGQEDRPAYIAHGGMVYDVSDSRLWRKGTHVRRHFAGNDLTAEIEAAPHDTSVFERVPKVGVLSVPEPEPEAPPSVFQTLLDLYFNLHPHGVAVHFPVALGVVCAVFVALYLLTGTNAFELTAYYLLWVAVVMTPLAMLSGAVSWWFNYGHSFDNRFLIKIFGSSLLLVLALIALILRAANPTAVVDREAVGWVYAALVLAMVPVVATLGWVGARIVFPPRKSR
jgi:predicted heme/steroid binding protein/uncharacterized membrane protein